MRRIPASSRTYVDVSALVPTGAALDMIEFAFLPASASGDPADEDWRTGGWFRTATKLVARILIGPGGGVLTLTPGTYQVWIRATSAPERVTDVAGHIVII